MSVEKAFAYMADVRNFEAWDPGIVKSVQLSGEGPSKGAMYEVTVATLGKETAFRYEVTDFEPPNRIRLVGKASLLTSIDIVDVAATDDGTIVTYDATVVLPFPLSFADRLVDKALQRIGDRAAHGLEAKLGGTLVS